MPSQPQAQATATAGGGIGLAGLLFVVLLVLKLTGLATLSWWWVFSPLLIAWGLAILFIIIFVLIAVFVSR
jgi:hypothetical protein